MALTATVRRFELALADSDRGVYEQLDLRVAQHPSESERYLIARVVARALEHAEGVDFTRGLAVDDEPALWRRDLRGDLQAWIEIGAPSPERLHRASKLGARIVVYGWRQLDALAAELAARAVHRAEAIELYALDADFLDAVAATLDRNNRWDLAVAGGTLYLGTARGQHETAVTRVAVVADRARG
jgi:uncharacterized protein YaeQ